MHFWVLNNHQSSRLFEKLPSLTKYLHDEVSLETVGEKKKSTLLS